MFDNLCGGVRMTLVRPIHSTSVLIGRIWNAHTRHFDERISPLTLPGEDQSYSHRIRACHWCSSLRLGEVSLAYQQFECFTHYNLSLYHLPTPLFEG